LEGLFVGGAFDCFDSPGWAAAARAGAGRLPGCPDATAPAFSLFGAESARFASLRAVVFSLSDGRGFDFSRFINWQAAIR
jgi:hypothetical protein